MTLPLGWESLNALTCFGTYPVLSLPVQNSTLPCLLKSTAGALAAPPPGSSPPPQAAATSRALSDTAAMRTRRAGRTKVIQASLRCRDTHPWVPLGQSRGNPSQKRNISHQTLRFVIDALTHLARLWKEQRLEVQTSLSVLETLGRDRMEITFPEQDVRAPADLDLGAVLGVEQHPVSELDGPHAGANGGDLSPRQAAADGDRRRDQDPTAAPPLAGLALGGHEHPVVQHADGEGAAVRIRPG